LVPFTLATANYSDWTVVGEGGASDGVPSPSATPFDGVPNPDETPSEQERKEEEKNLTALSDSPKAALPTEVTKPPTDAEKVFEFWKVLHNLKGVDKNAGDVRALAMARAG
jgi:hypothetical protein